MVQTRSSFEWPIVHETTRVALVASRVFDPFLDQKRARNLRAWTQPDSWKLGFYCSTEDTRLWVPRRDKHGLPNEQDRVINFGHPLGRKALRVLLLGYGIGFVALAMTVLAIVGVRW